MALEMTDRVAHGKALPTEVVEQVVAKTDGVPLFVEELTKTVLESSLDPEGQFLFAAGSASDRLASYRIESNSGALTPIDTYDVGKRPMEVCAVHLGN